MGRHFNESISTTLDIFDSLIRPILLYSSDFWGCMKLPKHNPIEKLHLSFCKQLLGVNKQTTNVGVLLELGQIPITLHACKFAIKNWERIKMKKANDFLLATHKNAITVDLPWISTIKSLLESKGMLVDYIRTAVNEYHSIHKILFQRLSDEFHQHAFETLRDENSKLRTYGLFKTDIGLERYLDTIKNKSKRIIVTKLRLSDHHLMIETGRHKKLPKERRFCPFCPKAVENESHFLLRCPMYAHLRNLC